MASFTASHNLINYKLKSETGIKPVLTHSFPSQGYE